MIEGFHGVPYDKPLARTREIVDICRKVWAREEQLTNDGPLYPLPLPEGQGTGLGKPLKIIAHPVRPRIPIYVAALGEKNVELTAEIADGWLPLFFLPEKAKEVFGPSLDAGAAKRSRRPRRRSTSAPAAWSAIGEPDETKAVLDMFARPDGRPLRRRHGRQGQATSTTPSCSRYGYEAEAAEIQDLYLAGKKDEAAANVPDELLELTNLCGTPAFVQERIAAFREAGVTRPQRHARRRRPGEDDRAAQGLDRLAPPSRRPSADAAPAARRAAARGPTTPTSPPVRASVLVPAPAVVGDRGRGRRTRGRRADGADGPAAASDPPRNGPSDLVEDPEAGARARS